MLILPSLLNCKAMHRSDGKREHVCILSKKKKKYNSYLPLALFFSSEVSLPHPKVVVTFVSTCSCILSMIF